MPKAYVPIAAIIALAGAVPTFAMAAQAQAPRAAAAAQPAPTRAAMVKNLESDDPAVRLFAIEGLRRLTGDDFGYDYYADADQRAPAVQRWKQWLEMQSSD